MPVAHCVHAGRAGCARFQGCPPIRLGGDRTGQVDGDSVEAVGGPLAVTDVGDQRVEAAGAGEHLVDEVRRLDEGLLHLYAPKGLLREEWEERRSDRFVVDARPFGRYSMMDVEERGGLQLVVKELLGNNDRYGVRLVVVSRIDQYDPG